MQHDQEWLEFIETEAFRQKLERIGDVDLLEQIQTLLLANPLAGALLRSGLRKVRIKAPQRAEGKRGGYRVFYYHVDAKGCVYLVWLLDKREADNLTVREERAFQAMVNSIQVALRGGR